MKRTRKSFNFFIYAKILGLIVCSPSAWASFSHSIMQSADITGVKRYVGSFHTDILTNNGGSLNFTGHIRTGLKEDLVDIEFLFGTGKIDFQLGALAKMSLLPDIDGQVGLSLLGGVHWISDEFTSRDDSIFVLKTGLITSKNFSSDIGNLTPYASFLWEVAFFKSDAVYPVTLAAGGSWSRDFQSPFKVFVELGLDLKDSTNMLSGGMSYNFQ